MKHYTVTIHHEYSELLLCSLRLCIALHCPEMTREGDLKQPSL